MAIDLFANNASAVVSVGGTAAPASGTSEQWTVSNVVGLTATAGKTQMRLIDPAAPGELMILTDLTGTTATVTRGAEGTAPVAHAAGFTAQAVATAGSLIYNEIALRRAGFHLPRDGGFKAWTFDPVMISGRAAFINTVQGSTIFVAEDVTVSTLTAYIGQAGAGLTDAALALYDSAGNLLAQTGSMVTPFQGTGLVSAALSSPQNLKAGRYYGFAIGQTGTTKAQFEFATSTSGGIPGAIAAEGGAFPVSGWRASGQSIRPDGTSTMPSAITSGQASNNYWGAAS